MTDGEVLLFVYGTLRDPRRRQELLGEGTLVERVRTAPRYRLWDLGEYPGLLRGGSTRVVGELHRVAVSRLPDLDRYEDVPSLYVRGPVELEDGRVVEAYVLVDADRIVGGRPIASGDWLEGSSLPRSTAR